MGRAVDWWYVARAINVRVAEHVRRADLDFGSDAMQSYRLAVPDWVDIFAIERQDHRKTADVRDKPRCLGRTHTGTGNDLACSGSTMELTQGLGQKVLPRRMG